MNTYAAQIRRLQELGPRNSGNPSHHLLIEDVAAELAEAGYEVNRDTHTFTRWDVEGEGVRLSIAGRAVPLSSAWPYSGETPAEGVTAPLILLQGRRKNWKSAAGKIAVIEVHNLDVPTSLLVRTWNGDDLPFASVTSPILGSELAGTDLTRARDAGVRGVVAVWRGLSDDAAHAQYLPFTRDYQGIPAVWAPESQANPVIEAAKAGASATLTLAAVTTPETTMDTLWAISPGTGPDADEAVLVVTHSDGGNPVEENGHLGLLALAHDAAATPHNRTIVFIYTAGHLRIPAVTPHGQATTAWLDAHHELWAPDSSGLHAVCGLVIEHLGAKHAAIDPATGRYQLDGTAEPEVLYATTQQLAQLVKDTWSGVEVQAARPVRPGALVHFGEGEPLFQHHIPAIALVTGPLYLLAETEDDLVDIEVLTRQVDSFRRLQAHVAGEARSTTFGQVELPGRIAKLAATARVLGFLLKRR